MGGAYAKTPSSYIVGQRILIGMTYRSTCLYKRMFLQRKKTRDSRNRPPRLFGIGKRKREGPPQKGELGGKREPGSAYIFPITICVWNFSPSSIRSLTLVTRRHKFDVSFLLRWHYIKNFDAVNNFTYMNRIFFCEIRLDSRITTVYSLC